MPSCAASDRIRVQDVEHAHAMRRTEAAATTVSVGMEAAIGSKSATRGLGGLAMTAMTAPHNGIIRLTVLHVPMVFITVAVTCSVLSATATPHAVMGSTARVCACVQRTSKVFYVMGAAINTGDLRAAQLVRNLQARKP